MKFTIVFVVVAAIACTTFAAPAGPTDETLRFENDNIGLDGYRYAYETSGGIRAEETGQLNNAGQENEAIAVRGSYSYLGDDGITYTVEYIADENGFQPTGVHLPRA